MKIIKNIRSMLEEKRLWKDYIVENKVAEFWGRLTSRRPYFMSFDDYKKQRADASFEPNKKEE